MCRSTTGRYSPVDWMKPKIWPGLIRQSGLRDIHRSVLPFLGKRAFGIHIHISSRLLPRSPRKGSRLDGTETTYRTSWRRRFRTVSVCADEVSCVDQPKDCQPNESPKIAEPAKHSCRHNHLAVDQEGHHRKYTKNEPEAAHKQEQPRGSLIVQL